jgi:dolichol-phosphate mannosyltransferase
MAADISISSLPHGKSITGSDHITSKDDITVVIPTLNEAMGIGHVLEELKYEGYYNILLIDGYSFDDTIQIANSYDVDILHQVGKGKTGAIKTSIDHIKTPYFIVIDGDTTYSPKDIKNFIPHMKYYNQIIGARDNGNEHIPKLHKIGNWIINKFFNLMFGTNLTDVCSGLYALNTAFSKELILDTQGFEVEVEIAAQSANSGSITEIPISFSKRVGTKKLNPWKDGLKILYAIFKLAGIYNSVILYSFIFALTIIPSTLLLGWVFLEAVNENWHNGYALIGIMLSILAAQAFTISTIASQQRHMEQRLLRKIKNIRT